MREGLTAEEKLQLARDSRDFFWHKRNYAEDRENKVNDAIRLVELQIATIVFAFSAVFSQEISQEANSTLVLILFGVGLSALALSVVFGLINEWGKVEFWQERSRRYDDSFREYQKVLKKEISLEEAWAYQEGQLGGEGYKRFSSPVWPLILQTALLGVGGFTILVVRLISVF